MSVYQMTSTESKKMLFYVNCVDDIRHIEDFIMDVRAAEERTQKDLSDGPYTMEFVLADKEAGNDTFTWTAETLDGLDDHIVTLNTKLKANLFYFIKDRENKPPVGHVVVSMNVMSILHGPDSATKVVLFMTT